MLADPGEHNDVAAKQHEQLATMVAALEAEMQTVFHPDRGCDNGSCAEAACAAAVAAGGYWAPYLV